MAGCCVAARSSITRGSCVPPPVSSTHRQTVSMTSVSVRRGLLLLDPLYCFTACFFSASPPSPPEGIEDKKLAIFKLMPYNSNMPAPKEQLELTFITKTYDLILWSCNRTSKFPRNHRFVLGERIERNLYDVLEI